jgi:hypothetical protein
VSNQSASGTAARGEPASGPVLSVSLGLWQDRPAAEVVRTAEVADALGYGEIWIGEMGPATRSARSSSANCGTNCAIDERALIH